MSRSMRSCALLTNDAHSVALIFVAVLVSGLWLVAKFCKKGYMW